MKIAQFTDTFDQTNGVSIHVKALAAKLAQKKHKVTVYTGSGTAKGYKVVNLPHIKYPLAPDYEIIFTKGMKVKADIAHAHTPYFTQKIAFRSNMPVVTTTHTSPAQVLSMYKANFLSSFAWKFLVRFHNKSDHVICQTKQTEKAFRAHGLKKPTTIISTGLDTKKFSNGKAKRFLNKFDLPDRFVYSVCRLSLEKRPELLLRACKELKIPIVLISTGPLKDKLERKYPKAHFLGYVSDQDKINGYAAATIFGLASMNETEGIVIAEANAAKTPVLSSKLPCIAEFIKDGQSGFLFSNYSQLKQKLKKLWGSDSLQKKFSREAKKTVKQKDINVVTNKILKVYKSLL